MTDPTRPPPAVMAAIFVFVAGGLGYAFYNRAVNYTLVDAVVEKAERRCYEMRKTGRQVGEVRPSWNGTPPMDSDRIPCDGYPVQIIVGPTPAADFDNARHDFMFLWYRYPSPIDGRIVRDVDYEIVKNDVGDIKPGDTIRVRAHNTKAKVSYIDSGNL